jgi:hypothetical protein
MDLRLDAHVSLESHGLVGALCPISSPFSLLQLEAKEGLALINGTQFMSALGAEAIVRAQRIARQADVVAALTLEALHGSSRPFHPSIHGVRVRLILFFILLFANFFQKN